MSKTKRGKLKKVLIWSAAALVVLYFGANLALYYYINSLFPEDEMVRLNRVPETLTLNEKDTSGETLDCTGITFNFPFEKKNIDTVSPAFHNGMLSGIIFTLKNRGLFTLTVTGDNSGASYDERMKRAYYARPDDLSLWNLPANRRLMAPLRMKSHAIRMYGRHRMFDLETRHLRGYFIEGEMRSVLLFRKDGISYEISNITGHSHDIEGREEIPLDMRGFISSIRLIKDADESLKRLEALKKKGALPEELVMACRISVEGPTYEKLVELRDLMIEKGYKSNVLDSSLASFREKPPVK